MNIGQTTGFYGTLEGMLLMPALVRHARAHADVPVQDCHLLRDGLRLRYRRAGSPSAPAVVLLHGATSNATTWDSLASQLVGAGFQAIAPDLRGHGLSMRSRRYPLPSFASDVIALLDALRIEQAIFVGHSLGGYIAATVAQRAPHRVTRLVLEDPAIPPRSKTSLRNRVPFHRDAKPPRCGCPSTVFAPHDTPEERPTQSTQARISPALLPSLIVGGMVKGRRYDPWAFAAIISQLRRPDPAWWERAGGMMLPTLVVSGGPSSTISERLLHDVAAHLPDATLRTIPVGHRIHSVAPQEFASEVLGFLAA